MRVLALLVITIMAGMASLGVVANTNAHTPDEFEFYGVADQACISSADATWDITWTIENDAGANPFGIVGTSFPVGFDNLEDDPAPGQYIEPGESSVGNSSHSVATASVTLTVTHDVTNGDDIDFTATVDRPAPCVEYLNTITIVKNADGAGDLDFDFVASGLLGNFDLEDDESILFTDVPDGTYTVTELDFSGWVLVDIDCTGAQVADTDVADNDVQITVDGNNDDAVCIFTNVPVEEPTPTATAEPTSTAVPTATAPVVEPTPQVIIIEAPAPPPVIVEVEVPSGRITPPSTGSAGLK